MEVFFSLVRGLENDFVSAIEMAEETTDELEESEIESIAEKAVLDTLLFIDNYPKNQAVEFSSYIKEKYLDRFVDFFRQTSNFCWMNEDQIKRVSEKACLIFDTGFDRNGYVGIAIAGYGDNEVFPHLVHLQINGVLDGEIRFSTIEKVEITEENIASIAPLAQTDVMQTFLFGINDRFIDDLYTEIPNLIQQTIDGIDNDCFVEGKKETVHKEIQGVTDKVLGRMMDMAREDYMQPIISSVATLPIEELALLAESMINITSVRRKVAIDNNIGTVGGPIDVAIM
jgi:hypothetical protein